MTLSSVLPGGPGIVSVWTSARRGLPKSDRVASATAGALEFADAA